MRTIIAFLTTLLVCTKFACGQSFKSDAANFVEVEYRKRNSVEDITEVEVHVTLDKVLEGEVGVEALTLEMLEEGRCWRPVTGAPVKRGRRYRWRTSILPCLKYNFRLALPSSSSSCANYLNHPTVVGGFPISKVDEAQTFSPSVPSQLRLGPQSSVQWDGVMCVSKYEVALTQGGQETVTVQETNNTRLDLEGECGEGRLEVRAVSGGQNSRWTGINFNSCPEEEEDGEESVTLDVDSFFLSSVEEVEECPIVRPVCGSEKQPPSTGGPYTREVLPSSYNTVSTIVIPVLLAVILLCIIVAGLFCIMKRKRTRDGAEIEKI